MTEPRVSPPPASARLHDRSGLELACMLREREVSSRELTTYFLDRIDRLDGQVNAFVRLFERRAHREATLSDQELSRDDVQGVFAGVPIGVKDTDPVRRSRFDIGSRALRYAWSPIDSPAVKRIRVGGHVIVGKTATSEFAMMPIVETDIHPPVRNPWSRAHTPGGSSGGAAAAVAAGMLPMALGVTVLFIGLGTAMNSVARGARSPELDVPQVPARELWRLGAPLMAAMLCFMALLVILSHGVQWPITAVIIAITPLGAWIVNACVGQYGAQGLNTGTRMLWSDMAGFRSMASEVMMFLASGCAGTVIAGAIPDVWTSQIGTWVSGAPVLACFALSALIVALCAAAIHPMLCAVIVGTSLDPITLGLPLPVHLTALLVGWGLAITITPFSVLSLMASRWSGVPVLTISLRANGGFVALALLVSSLLLGALAVWTKH